MATYVKGNAVANATSYELLEKVNGIYTSLEPVVTGSEINFEVSALGLAAGDHVFVVVAKADGYANSEYSNEVTYTIEGTTSGGDGDSSVDDENQILTESYPYLLDSSRLITGGLASSGVNSDTNRLTSGYFPVLPGLTVDVKLTSGWTGYAAYQTSTGSYSLIGTQEWTSEELFTFGGDKNNVYQCVIVLKKDGVSSLTPDMFTEADGGTITVDFASSDLVLTNSDLVVGGLSTSSVAVNTTETNRLRTNWLGARKGTTISCELPDGFSAYIAWHTKGMAAMEYTSWTTGTITKTFDGDYGFVIIFKQGSTTFTDTSAFTSTISVTRSS